MTTTDPWVVHKFGGSSVADADCFRRVAAILDTVPAPRVGVVLSACKGVTDAPLGEPGGLVEDICFSPDPS